MADLAKLAASPSSQLTQTGLAYIKSLKDQGQLPGVEKNGQGQFRVGAGNPGSPETMKLSFPFAKTVTLVLANSPGFTYNYEIVKSSDDANWHMQRAWKSDSGGNVLDEFPVKSIAK